MYHILIVDDEMVERRGVQYLLTKREYDFTYFLAGDGEEALQIIDGGLQPDILITDIRMPFMDGLHLIEKIRERRFNTQIVIYSAFNEFDYARQALRFGVSDYLLKPLEPNELYQLMDQFIQRIETRRNTPDIEKRTATDVPMADNSDQAFLYRKICRIIEDHYSEDLSVEGIAQRVSHSVSHVSRVFAEESGETLVKYLTRFRMEKAAELLRSTIMRVAEISVMVGYATPTYFGQVFRKTFDMTPNTYREKYGE